MRRYFKTFSLFTLAAALPCASAAVDFEKQVLPIFQENCLDCHGADKQKSGLRLDRRGIVVLAQNAV